MVNGIKATAVLLQVAVLLLPQYEAKNEIQPTIIGGQKATPGEFPFVVAILLGRTLWCSGALIRPDLVLTNAKCSSSLYLPAVSVVAGTVTPSVDETNTQKLLKPLAAVLHPDPNSKIGLIHLDGRFPLSKTIKLAKLPTYLGEPKDATSGIALGWGFLDEERERRATHLQRVDLPLVDNATCKEGFGRRDYFDLNLQFCAGERNKGGCLYDEGAPFVLSSDVSTIHGLYRSGGPCEGNLAGSVFTRVGSYLPWLLEEMSKEPVIPTMATSTTTEKTGGAGKVQMSLVLSILAVVIVLIN